MAERSTILNLISKIEDVLFSDHAHAKILAKSLLDLSYKENDALGLFKANNFLGILSSERGMADEALNYFSAAMSYTLFDGLDSEKPVLLNNIGTTLSDRKNYFEAIENFTNALEIIFEKGYRKDLIFTLNLNIAGAYLQIDKPDEALKVIKEAMGYLNEGSVEDVTEMLGLMADAYLKKGNPDKAYSYILRCEEEAQKTNHLTIKVMVDHYKAKYFELIKDDDAASLFYNRIFTIQLTQEPFYFFNRVAYDYIRFLIASEKIEKAITVINQAIELAKQKNWTWAISDYYRYLSECFKHLCDFQKAVEVIEQYLLLEETQKSTQYSHLYQCFKIQEKVLDMSLTNKVLNDSVGRLKAFNLIISQINSTNDLSKMVDTQLQNLKTLFKMDTFALGLYRDENQRIEYEFYYENGERINPMDVEYNNMKSFSNWVRLNDKPVIISDIDDFDYITVNYPNVKQTKDDIVNTGNASSSIVIWPMTVEGRSIGLINCQAVIANAFSTFDLELIEMLASHLAIAVDNRNQKRALSTAVDRLNKLSYIDGLTGIYNRQALNEYMPALYQKAFEDGNTIAFAMLDLDNFKKLNDQYGHQEGDHCLAAFASLLKDVIGNMGHVYRYGGDEFSIMFIGIELDVVDQLLHEVISRSTDFYSMGGLLPVTASIGAVYMEAGRDISLNLTTFINYADNALYIAKNEGKGMFKKVML